MADYPWRTAFIGAVLTPLIAWVRTELDGPLDVALCVLLGAAIGAFAGWSERWRQIRYRLRQPRGYKRPPGGRSSR